MSVGTEALRIAQRLERSGDWLVLPWCIGHVVPCTPAGQVQTPAISESIADSTRGAVIPASCNTSDRLNSHDRRVRTARINVCQGYHYDPFA